MLHTQKPPFTFFTVPSISLLICDCDHPLENLPLSPFSVKANKRSEPFSYTSKDVYCPAITSPYHWKLQSCKSLSRSTLKMTKRSELVPAEDVDLSTVQYETEVIQAPHITGLALKLSTKMLETPGVGSLIIYLSKKQNKMNEVLRNRSIPETPMSRPEFPPQEQETGVEVVDEDGKPNERLESAANCLPPYDSASLLNWDSAFRYWKIRDYAHAYRSKLVTPSTVAEHFISVINELKEELPHAPLLISFDEEELKKQAADSTKRFQEGKPMSILDGIFIAIKDDIDCLPHPTRGGTTWIHELRAAEKDAVCVSRLRCCGAILVGKANMHEIGMGVTGNNPNYGTTRNPHDLERYPGGSSSGPAAIVASGLCPAALGTDAGGSVRIPASLCGVVGLKPTFGRIDKEGYSAILGSNPADKLYLKPSPPCLPKLTSSESLECLGLLRLGKYTKWFNDVHSTEISDKCDEILKLLSKTYGTEMKEIVIPELHDIRIAHLFTIGAEALYLINPYCADGNDSRLTCDTRTFIALFRSFGGADFIAAQCLRRRLMYHHMRIFEKVDAIVTPTTCMTAPLIPPSSLSYGESNIWTTGYLARFVIGANLLGFPAISVPVGYDKQGLPIGLQLIGRPWGEATLLRLASAIEELCSNFRKKPVTFYDVLKAK